MSYQDAPLMDLLEGRTRMQIGTAQVLENAGENWVDAACSHVQENFAGQTILAEAWKASCIEVGIKPHHHNGWGALIGALKSRKIIRATDLPYQASKCVTSNAHKSPLWFVVPKNTDFQPTMALEPATPRPVILREEDHKYIYEPTGQQMKVSVTAVTNWFKDRSRFGSNTTQRDIGIHVHAWLHEHVNGRAEIFDRHCPEGHDCSPWIEALLADEDLKEARILASEFTMCDRRKSLGGQLDLLVELEGKIILVDLKTKSEKWNGASKKDKLDYAAQAGGYMHLWYQGDDSKGSCQYEIAEAQTLICQPNNVVWLDPYSPKKCLSAWEDCWGKYAAAALTKF